MRVPGDLGFRGLSTLFFFFLVSVVGFVIKRTWRNSVEKQREIMRLVAMASEESARVELEAAHEYGTVSPVVKLSQCAVCYCPTTTRCSRCKAVRYCSGKCQIIHWRQGHKEECNPPTNSFQFNDPGSDFDQCPGSQEQKLYGSSLEDDGKVGPFVDAEETHMGSESFIVSSFVGITSESSADVSVAEVPFSSRPDSLDVPVFDNIFHDGQYTAVNSKESELSASQSSSRLDTIVNDMLCSRTSKQTAPSCIVGEADSESTNSVPSNINVSSVCMIPKPSTVHSDFWEGAFDSYESGKDTCDDSTPSSFSEAGEDILVESKSPLHFSSSLSKHAVCNSRPLRPETEDHLSDDENHTTLRNKKPTDRVSQTEKNNSDASTLKSLPKEKRSLSTTSDEKPSSTIGEYSFQNVKSSVVDSVNRVPAGSSEVSHSSLNVSTGLKTSVRKVVHQFKSSKHSKHNSVGMGSEIVEKCNNKMLFPYELFVKLYHWNKLELRPCGLANCGNSCYANAVLQCLAFTRPLTAYLLQGLHSKACPKKEWCFTCEFERLILKAKEGKSPLSPMRILSQLHSIGSQLGHGREEDAHEFLRYAIDTMQSVCLKEAGEDAVGPLAEETTLIGLIFGGYLRSKIKCMKCHWKSEKPERMMDLTVEIQGDIGTLDEALRKFTTTEILDGENKYHCSRCKSYEKAKKKLTVLEAPNVLTIALKRFQCGKFGKLNKSVQFPEILNLAPYMSGTSDKSPIYRLYAVVVHLDVMNASFSGHYVCYVSNMLGKWFKIDDSTVKPVELERVLSKGAYMLLYSRCSPRAPSLKRNTILFEESKISRSSHCSEAIRSSYNGNNTSCREGPNSTFSRTGSYAPQRRPEDYSCWTPLDSPATFESFDPFDRRFHPLHRIPKVDSTSDSSSLLSNSDEGSCSTESTRDSIDDCTDYIFGEAGRSWNYPLRVMEDYDGSSSPLFRKTKPSPIAVPSSFPETSGYPSYRREMVVEADSTMQPLKSSDAESLHDKGNHPFLHSDTSKQCRKLTDSSKNSSNSSSSRDTDLEKLGWCNPLEARHGVSQRKSSRDRTTQTKY